MKVLLVGLGGFAGSILRYWLSGVAQDRSPEPTFPLGTLLVNVVGCFAVGVIAQLVEERGFLHPETRALLVVGVLGGFTTMSAFANETVTALEDGAFLLSAANVALTVALCLGAAWSGRLLAHLVWR